MSFASPLVAFLLAIAAQTAPSAPPPPPATDPAAPTAPAPTSPATGGDPAPHITPTVNLDPEHPEAIEGWWTNGEQLLEVAPDGAYHLWSTQSRYEKPMERGRWHRQNHAVFWLEPYSARKESRTRVPLSKVNDHTIITIRKYAPMSRFDTPPVTEEDFYIGTWSGAGGALELSPAMRYRFVAPTLPNTDRPVVISSHRGAWRLKDGHLELLPDSPAVAALRFDPQRDDQGNAYMRLRGVEGTLDRVIERVAKPAEPPPAHPAPPDAPTPGTTPPYPRTNGG